MSRPHTADPEHRVALIGHPVAHSRSPAMHAAAFAAVGLRARYELWDTAPEELGARVAALRAPEMLGANVTIPYKVDIAPLLDVLAPEVGRAGGAVNTITRETDATSGAPRLVGHNTDLGALVRVIETHQPRHTARDTETARRPGAAMGERVLLVLGAGGAARAAVGAAHMLGYQPFVATRNPAAGAAALAAGGVLALGNRAALADLLPRVDVLVQATSVGMAAPGDSPLALDLLGRLPPHALVVDLVYAPHETALVARARAAGIRAVDGLELLLYQGMAAFTLWTGLPAPETAMRAALRIPARVSGR